MDCRRHAFRKQPRPTWISVLALIAGLATGPSVWAAAKSNAAGPEWPPISPEEKSLVRLTQDPEADAVVLNNERIGKMTQKGDQRVNVLDYHVRMKVLTERGKEYAEVRIPAGKYSRVENIQARTVLKDGRVVPVPADQVFQKVVAKVGGFKETAWVFNFPQVEPGAIIEYRYRRYDDRMVFLDPFFFAGPEFTLRAKVSQAVPGDMSYAILCELCPDSMPPTRETWREGKLNGYKYVRELRDLPGYRGEGFMPPARDANPRLEMLLTGWRNVVIWGIDRQDRFFVDWASVARYAAAYYQEAMKDMGDMKKLVGEWTAGLADEDAKIRSVYRHVQLDFRYNASDQVFAGSRALKDIIKDRVADNEEKAVLLIAALKAIGVTAHPALVCGRHGGSLHAKFYSLSQFTHTVAAIPQADGSYLWLDPTLSHAPFGFVAWYNSNAAALLIKGKEGEIVVMPPRKQPSSTRYDVTLKPLPDGSAEATVVAEFMGEDAMDLREELAPAAESARLNFMQNWVSAKRPGTALIKHAIKDLDDSEKPLKISMDLRMSGLVTLADDALLVRGCAMTCRETNPMSRTRRVHPYYVERGWDEEEVIHIGTANGLRQGTLPRPASAESPIGALSFVCQAEEAGGVRCTRKFAARRGQRPAGVHEAVRKMYDGIVQIDRSMVSLVPAESGAAGD